MNEERKNCQENFPITFSIRLIKKSYVTRNLYFTFEYEKIFTLIIFNMKLFLKEPKKEIHLDRVLVSNYSEVLSSS